MELLDFAQVGLQEILQEMEQQERKGFQKYLKQLLGEVYLKLERFGEAYEALKAATLDYLTSLCIRYHEDMIKQLFLLGQALEGLGEFNQAQRYYADAYFAPNPQVEARAGLERIYQSQHGLLDGFASFLKTEEAEYQKRVAEEHEIIRQNLVKGGAELKLR